MIFLNYIRSLNETYMFSSFTFVINVVNYII